MAKVVVNAVGDQCPVPVVKANKALKEMTEPGTLEVQVDNETAVQNLCRLADSKKLKAFAEKRWISCRRRAARMKIFPAMFRDIRRIQWLPLHPIIWDMGTRNWGKF